MTTRAFQQKIGYHFTRQELVVQALTHRSAEREHLERLEYLGDALLSLVIAELLYQWLPDCDEGNLSRIRANLVCQKSLLEVAAAWQLGDFLIVGSGERSAAGNVKSSSILADGVEALLGAVFLDAGFDAAKQVALTAWQPLLAKVEQNNDQRDAKSRLQEFTQGQGWGLPRYEVSDAGVGRALRFTARCYIRDRQLGVGQGERKKSAELEAAAAAWQNLEST